VRAGLHSGEGRLGAEREQAGFEHVPVRLVVGRQRLTFGFVGARAEPGGNLPTELPVMHRSDRIDIGNSPLVPNPVLEGYSGQST